jgi:hypothetical protein
VLLGFSLTEILMELFCESIFLDGTLSRLSQLEPPLIDLATDIHLTGFSMQGTV